MGRCSICSPRECKECSRREYGSESMGATIFGQITLYIKFLFWFSIILIVGGFLCSLH